MIYIHVFSIQINYRWQEFVYNLLSSHFKRLIVQNSHFESMNEKESKTFSIHMFLLFSFSIESLMEETDELYVDQQL